MNSSKYQKFAKEIEKTFLNFDKDFQKLYESGQFYDFCYHGLNAHTLYLETLTRLSIEKIKDIFDNFDPKVCQKFINYIYAIPTPEFTTKEEKLILKSFDHPQLFYNFTNRISTLYNSSHSKDFSIIVQGKHFYIHKFILQARSSLFSVFFQSMNSEITQVKNYSECSSYTMYHLIYFMYHDRLNLEEILNLKKKDRFKLMNELANAIEFYQLSQNSMLWYYVDTYGNPDEELKAPLVIEFI
ncbi:pep-cterm sorting domain-containing protein [Anaeramoeba flamelloides]|uniref:Pep-cterm sorting domain-containing protein n=1 Tax=Anaeramoeba flamelloides TaxID=1746091 RepID=A0AAV8AB55_9EUKA|nr:pep-cterm sorting domain-containing protein [Anaeramoeba flamelloides]